MISMLAVDSVSSLPLGLDSIGSLVGHVNLRECSSSWALESIVSFSPS